MTADPPRKSPFDELRDLQAMFELRNENERLRKEKAELERKMTHRREGDPPEFDPRDKREYRGVPDPTEFRNPEEAREGFRAKVAGQEVWYQGKQGPLFLLVIGLLAAIGIIIYQDVNTTKAAHDNQVTLLMANVREQRIGNWLLQFNQDNRPPICMPREAWLIADITNVPEGRRMLCPPLPGEKKEK